MGTRDYLVMTPGKFSLTFELGYSMVGHLYKSNRKDDSLGQSSHRLGIMMRPYLTISH